MDHTAPSSETQSRQNFVTPSLAAPISEPQQRVLASLDWHFVLSASANEQLPQRNWPEIVFVGRSNVGKSSLLNALAGRKALARTSRTPGRTRALNFFACPSLPVFFVDMPGMGYAQAPRETAQEWVRFGCAYLQKRREVRLVCVLWDCRRGLCHDGFLDMVEHSGISWLAVATKTDKLPGSALTELQEETARSLARYCAVFPHVFMTSARKRTGISELDAHIAECLGARLRA